MASSYSYGNVETHIVPEDAATSERAAHSYGEDPKYTRAKRLIRPSLLLHLVSFTAVIWLIVHVVQLDDEFARFRNETTPIGGLSWQEGGPSQQADAEQATNVKSKTVLRPRRQQVQDVDDSDTYLDYDVLSLRGLPSLHVVGNQQNQLELSTESWFTFHTSGDGTMGSISHENLKLVRNQFIEITMPGYYFVYSQICYAGDGSSLIGHEVVVRPNCGDGNDSNEFTILESIALQVTLSAGQRPSGDSGYSGGVFYLAANDRVGVRPLQGGGPSQYFTKDNGKASYFGAFLLSKSSGTDVDPDLRRCP